MFWRRLLIAWYLTLQHQMLSNKSGANESAFTGEALPGSVLPLPVGSGSSRIVTER